MEFIFNGINIPEAEFLLWIQEHVRNTFLHYFFNIITLLGEKGLPCILFALVLLIIPKTRSKGTHVGMALAFNGLLVNVILKNLFERPRPFWDTVLGGELVTDTLFDFMVPHSFAFPSGHTAIVFAAAVATYGIMKKRYSIILTVLAVLVGLSRLYIGVHYPTDVLAGAIAGALAAVLAKVVIAFVKKRWGEKINKIIPNLL